MSKQSVIKYIIKYGIVGIAMASRFFVLSTHLTTGFSQLKCIDTAVTMPFIKRSGKLNSSICSRFSKSHNLPGLHLPACGKTWLH